MSEWLKLILAAGVGGWLAIFSANKFYLRKIWKEQESLALAKLRKERAKEEAEIDDILTSRIK